MYVCSINSIILPTVFHVARRTYATIFFSENRQSIIEECLKDHPKFELKDCEDGYQSAYINAIVVQVVLVLITIYYNIVLIQTYRHMKRFPEQYPANSWSSVKPISSVSNNPTYPDANYRQEPFGIQTMNAGHSLPVYTPPYSLGKGSEDIELAPVNGNTPPTNPNAGR